MPKLKSIAELQSLQQQLQKDIKRRTQTNATITVGMGTCGNCRGRARGYACYSQRAAAA